MTRRMTRLAAYLHAWQHRRLLRHIASFRPRVGTGFYAGPNTIRRALGMHEIHTPLKKRRPWRHKYA